MTFKVEPNLLSLFEKASNASSKSLLLKSGQSVSQKYNSEYESCIGRKLDILFSPLVLIRRSMSLTSEEKQMLP